MLKVKKKAKPEKILMSDDMYILWQDGKESHIGYFELRDSCPCATCIDEFSGVKKLDSKTIPKDIPKSTTPIKIIENDLNLKLCLDQEIM